MTGGGLIRKGSAGWYLCLISGGEHGFNPLDSRFRGNDGGYREGEGSAGWYLHLISGGEHSFSRLDSRFRGNDGRRIGNDGGRIGNNRDRKRKSPKRVADDSRRPPLAPHYSLFSLQSANATRYSFLTTLSSLFNQRTPPATRSSLLSLLSSISERRSPLTPHYSLFSLQSANAARRSFLTTLSSLFNPRAMMTFAPARAGRSGGGRVGIWGASQAIWRWSALRSRTGARGRRRRRWS